MNKIRRVRPLAKANYPFLNFLAFRTIALTKRKTKWLMSMSSPRWRQAPNFGTCWREAHKGRRWVRSGWWSWKPSRWRHWSYRLDQKHNKPNRRKSFKRSSKGNSRIWNLWPELIKISTLIKLSTAFKDFKRANFYEIWFLPFKEEKVAFLCFEFH